MMKKTLLASLLVGLGALSGCATPEQRAAKMIAEHGPVCDKLGFDRATDAWRNCVMQADMAESQRNQAAAAAYANIQRVMQPVHTPICNAYGCR